MTTDEQLNHAILLYENMYAMVNRFRDEDVVPEQDRERILGAYNETVSFLKSLPAYPSPLPSEDVLLMYYRTLICMTTIKPIRALLTANDGMSVLMNAMRRNAHSAILSAFVNLLFEEENKLRFIESYDSVYFILTWLQMNPRIRLQGARTAFTLSMIYDYKLRLGSAPGVIQALLNNATLQDSVLTYNCVGALANMAIHPLCKPRIVAAGAVPILNTLLQQSEETDVLQQSSRCMFSLSAHRMSRSMICQSGCLTHFQRVASLPNVSPEVLENLFGCLTNLCLTEFVAMHSPVTELAVSKLVSCEHNGVQRRCIEVIALIINTRPRIAELASQANVMQRLLRRLNPDALDVAVAQSALKIMTCVVRRNAAMAELVLNENLVARLSHLWNFYANQTDALMTVMHTINAVCRDDPPRVLRFVNTRIESLCNMCDSNENAGIRLAALEMLKNVSAVKSMRDTLIEHGALRTCFRYAYTETNDEMRKLAVAVLSNIVGIYLQEFVEDAEASAVDKDVVRLNRHLMRWVRAENAEPSATSGFITYVVPCVEGQTDIHVFAPLVQARLPTLYDRLESRRYETMPSVSRAAWTYLVEAIHTIEPHPPTLESEGAYALLSAIGALDDLNSGPLPTWIAFDEAMCRLWKDHMHTLTNDDAYKDFAFRVDASVEIEPIEKTSKRARRSSNAYMDNLKRVWAKDVDKQNIVRVHKGVLSAQSNVFRNMFHTDLGNWIEIDFEHSLDVLVVMLRYAYFGWDAELEMELSSDFDLVWNVLKAAHQYQMMGLLYSCERILGTRASVDEMIALLLRTKDMNTPCLWALIYSRYKTGDADTRRSFESAFHEFSDVKSVFENLGFVV